jgi:hypothetical protein
MISAQLDFTNEFTHACDYIRAYGSDEKYVPILTKYLNDLSALKKLNSFKEGDLYEYAFKALYSLCDRENDLTNPQYRFSDAEKNDGLRIIRQSREDILFGKKSGALISALQKDGQATEFITNTVDNLTHREKEAQLQIATRIATDNRMLDALNAEGVTTPYQLISTTFTKISKGMDYIKRPYSRIIDEEGTVNRANLILSFVCDENVQDRLTPEEYHVLSCNAYDVVNQDCRQFTKQTKHKLKLATQNQIVANKNFACALGKKRLMQADFLDIETLNPKSKKQMTVYKYYIENLSNPNEIATYEATLGARRQKIKEKKDANKQSFIDLVAIEGNSPGRLFDTLNL